MAFSVAKVHRLLTIKGSEEQRLFRLHWSHFRYAHQAKAKRAHVKQQVARLPKMPSSIPPQLRSQACQSFRIPLEFLDLWLRFYPTHLLAIDKLRL